MGKLTWWFDFFCDAVFWWYENIRSWQGSHVKACALYAMSVSITTLIALFLAPSHFIWALLLWMLSAVVLQSMAIAVAYYAGGVTESQRHFPYHH